MVVRWSDETMCRGCCNEGSAKIETVVLSIDILALANRSQCP